LGVGGVGVYRREWTESNVLRHLPPPRLSPPGGVLWPTCWPPEGPDTPSLKELVQIKTFCRLKVALELVVQTAAVHRDGMFESAVRNLVESETPFG